MGDYDASGVEDDRVAQAARRIIRQYHLQQSDRSEDSASSPPARPAGGPDDISSLRLALDEMSVKIEHMQRLMANREDLFMAALERIDRNLAKTDGRLDGVSAEVARIEARPALDLESALDEQRAAAAVMMREYSQMMQLGRTLLDEVRDVHGAAIATIGSTASAKPAPLR